jgi:hypothetical protein
MFGPQTSSRHQERYHWLDALKDLDKMIWIAGY